MGWYDTLVSAYDQIVETTDPITSYITDVGTAVAEATSAVIESVVSSPEIQEAANAATDAYNAAIDYLSDAYVYAANAIDSYVSADQVHDEAERGTLVDEAQAAIEDAITGISDAINNLIGVAAPPPPPPEGITWDQFQQMFFAGNIGMDVIDEAGKRRAAGEETWTTQDIYGTAITVILNPPKPVGELDFTVYVAGAVDDALTAAEADQAEKDTAALEAAIAGGIELRPMTKEEWMNQFNAWLIGEATPTSDPAFYEEISRIAKEQAISIPEFILPVNAVHKLIYGKSLFAAEPDEMTTFDYIEIALFILVFVSAAYKVVSKLAGSAKTADASTKGVKYAFVEYGDDAFEKGGKGMRLLEGALENPTTRPKTIYELAEFALRDPVRFSKYAKNMSETKYWMVMQELHKVAGGNKAANIIMTEVAKGTWMAQFIHLLPKLPAAVWDMAWKLAAMSIVGLIVLKEIPEYPGFGTYTMIDDRLWPEARESNERYKKWTDAMEASWGAKGIFKIPIVGDLLRAVFGAQRAQQTSWNELIDANLPLPAYLAVAIAPESAYIYINGANQGYFRSKWFELEAPGDYIVEVKKDGYETLKQEIHLEPGDEKTMNFTLVEGPARMGKITVDCAPQAEIWIKGIDSGYLTPHTFTFAPGTYDMEFKRVGYYSEVRTAYIREGDNPPISVTLTETIMTEREKTTGYVSFYTMPMGAYVFIDGIVSKYPTPTGVDLPPGAHDILIRMKGYKEIVDTINIVPAEIYRKDYELELLPAEVVEEVEKVWNVTVMTIPEGARIFVNDALWTYPTPTKIPLLEGTYIFRFEKSGYYPAEFEIPIPG